MEVRAEPRFKTDSVGVVEVIRDKAYTFEGRITDVSGIGFQIEMAEPLTEGETIRLTVDGLHMLAQVRHCMLDDSTYKIGVERVDQWDGKVSEGVMRPPIVAGRKAVLGRPALKNPVGSLRGAALRELFADPRLRTKQVKYRAVAILAVTVALAMWAGESVFLHGVGHKELGAATSKTGATKALPVRSTTRVNANPLNTGPASLPATGTRTEPSPQIAPATPTARVDATPNAAVSSGAGSAHGISIKASAMSWVSACADGAKVFEKLFNKGAVGEVRFSRQATVRSGNAGALELAIGNQSIGPMGSWGAVRTIKATPAGYEFVTTTPVLSCSIE
jgi:hypothetical protein